jgi:hypothetical protein
MTEVRSSRRRAARGRPWGGPSPGFMLVLVGAALLVGLLLRAAVPALSPE